MNLIKLAGLSLLFVSAAHGTEVVVDQDQGKVLVIFDSELQQSFSFEVEEASGAEVVVKETENSLRVEHLRTAGNGSTLLLRVRPDTSLNIKLAAGNVTLQNLSEHVGQFGNVELTSAVGAVNGARNARLEHSRSYVGARAWLENNSPLNLNVMVQAGLIKIE